MSLPDYYDADFVEINTDEIDKLDKKQRVKEIIKIADEQGWNNVKIERVDYFPGYRVKGLRTARIFQVNELEARKGVDFHLIRIPSERTYKAISTGPHYWGPSLPIPL